MVKPLKIFGHSIKWAVLLSLLAFLGAAIWIHEGERSLGFAKPWILKAVNSDDAPYVISVGDVTLNWTNVASLGKLRIKNVAFAKRDGNTFAQFPEVDATIDPLGFLPDRSLLHRVMLNNPSISAVRSAEGNVEFGFENTTARLPLSALIGFVASAGNGNAKTSNSFSLPFHDLQITQAKLTFTDEKTQTSIVSDAFNFQLKRRHGTYDAVLSLPFMVDAEPVMLSAGLRALPKMRQHVLALQLKDFPTRLICLFNTCTQGIEVEGSVNGSIAVGIADADFSVHGFSANISTKKARVTAPEWFSETLKLGASSLMLQGDWSKEVFLLTNAKLQLEDTSIAASGNVRHAEDGWYVEADASCTQIDVHKLYKYWPLTMAPDSRTWVTSKLKSGYAASGKIKLSLTPADFAAQYYSDKSVDALVDARNITFEYLPGFPKVENMNGMAHFTGTTLKIDGKGGSLMSGTTVNSAILWCPQLMSDHNPMEATLDLVAPASDVVTMLALKYFPFDDDFGLDAKTIKGTLGAKMKLKFNAFSNKSSSKPDEIHLEAVDYAIGATLKDVAQSSVHEAYDVHAMNGALKADNKGLSFSGTVNVGEAEVNEMDFTQTYGKPMTIAVKGLAGKAPRPLNDFTLSYASGAVPKMEVSGKRLDASVSYGHKENSLLANFPAMDLTVNLGELVLTKDEPFTQVKGKMLCTAMRCESADFEAKAGGADIHAAINQITGKRQFVMNASDAGAMLRAFDITDRMTKGRFEMKGDYDDSKTPPHLDARLLIDSFTLKNSKILGRIFSIGSLSGLQNALTGSGIAFEKFTANIGSQAGVIAVSKGKASGASMGITVEGMVDTNSTNLNLKGVVAPAYALNSILGKIPIIGGIAGGEEGLIAFNYWVKGTYADPEVGVNALSGLTPGFLRGIFGGGDGKSAKENDGKQKDSKPSGTKNKSAVKRTR